MELLYFFIAVSFCAVILGLLTVRYAIKKQNVEEANEKLEFQNESLRRLNKRLDEQVAELKKDKRELTKKLKPKKTVKKVKR